MRLVLLPLLLAACVTDLDVVNVRPLEPVPEVYPTWYAETEQCLGLRGDFDAIDWFVADELIYDGQLVGGVLDFPNRITMWDAVVLDSWAVKHEMAHHITQRGDELHDEHGRVPCET